MTIFTGETDNYEQALKLVRMLEALDIDANITAGGVAISCKHHQISLAELTCASIGVKFKMGHSETELNTLLKSKDGTKSAIEAKDNAQFIAATTQYEDYVRHCLSDGFVPPVDGNEELAVLLGAIDQGDAIDREAILTELGNSMWFATAIAIKLDSNVDEMIRLSHKTLST